MSPYGRIMVRFGELSTKGRNRKDFIRRLERNVRIALEDFGKVSYEVRYDHIYVVLNGEDPEAVLNRLKEVSGIHSLSLVKLIDPAIENVKRTALELIKLEQGKTFKVYCRRSNKAYPLRSEEIIREVAGIILRNTALKVDVHHPDIKFAIEMRDEGCYLSTRTVPAAGGFPLGSGGKVMHLLSGGIDSPVAAYLLLRRGMSLECVHFASPPYTSAAVIDKLKDILEVLTRYQESIRLHVVTFTKIQEAIYKHADESYAITLMRRMMLRLADKIRAKCHALALGSGESVGQVASQTLESLSVIQKVAEAPVLRPLVTTDKEEIIRIARRIGTYDISIRPYEDCCTIFPNRHPKTKPTLRKALFYESRFDYAPLLEEALAGEQVIVISRNRQE